MFVVRWLACASVLVRSRCVSYVNDSYSNWIFRNMQSNLLSSAFSSNKETSKTTRQRQESGQDKEGGKKGIKWKENFVFFSFFFCWAFNIRKIGRVQWHALEDSHRKCSHRRCLGMDSRWCHSVHSILFTFDQFNLIRRCSERTHISAFFSFASGVPENVHESRSIVMAEYIRFWPFPT